MPGSTKKKAPRLLQPQYTVKLKSPHPKQAELIRSAKPRRICRAGRRGGKTVGIAILAVEQFLQGRRVLYAAPVTDQLEAFWREVTNALAEVVDAGLFYKNETEHVIEKPGTQQRIRAKTAWNSDSLRGDYADLLILDEWQLMDENAWEEVGAPMLLDNNGSAVFIYTPPSLHSRSTSKAMDPRHAAKMFKRAEKDTTGRWLALHWTSRDNPHISTEALEEISRDMTRLAMKQEIEAEDTEEIPGALWKQSLIDDQRIYHLPELKRIVVGVDPTGSTTNEAGIVACGLGFDGHGYVIRDVSLLGTPEKWARAAVELYETLQADCIAVERNYGGDMVMSTIRTSNKMNREVRIVEVTSTRGKLLRAEPICSLYERKMVHHIEDFPALETEMTSYVPGEKSPNHLDALVFSLTELMLHETTSMAECGLGQGGLGKPISAGIMSQVL